MTSRNSPRTLLPMLALALLGAAVGAPLAPDALARGLTSAPSGLARVIDGDTLAIGDVRVRLEGIDAPEMGQTCGHWWLWTWDCGRAAARELEGLVRGQIVTCTPHGEDRHRRILGRCTAGSVDINAEMVRRGMAWAFVKYSRAYVDVEAEARQRRTGIWQGEAEPAWSYRERRWLAEAASAPGGCAIKGNVANGERIYHTPWSPWYGKVRMDKGRGERWFCSEADAIAAGWRPAYVR